MLESRHSYDFKQETKQAYAASPVNPGLFLRWSNQNMFRTSYGDAHCNKVAFGDCRRSTWRRASAPRATEDSSRR